MQIVIPATGIFLILISTICVEILAERCERTPSNTTKPRSPLNGKFEIIVTEYNRSEAVAATSYLPNTKYTITLQGERSEEEEESVQKFTNFMLVSDNKDNEDGDIGKFEIEDTTLTKFSHKCPNAVIEATTIAKGIVSVPWTSPVDGSGCILIRATVKESPDVWYMDEDPLAVTLCQSRLSDDHGPVLSTCCACDEAKYEVTFEGLWSRNTHPKDFPSNGWLTRFSDVIGASHTVDYRFWEYAKFASDGLRQVAERGATRMLESELKDESEHIRTIIKARGISYPNVTGKTFAVFRVDRKHHLMSLVSKIDPSPDWIVGVSGLELCLANCSWMEHRELNLYPFDAGTDSGITYISAEHATNPREPIRRISSTFPNDPASPFYDETGQDMKPIAKLYLNRQRLYEKTCDSPSSSEVTTGASAGDDKPISSRKACKVSGWGKWGKCSRSCGRGQKLRQRHYIDPEAAASANCKRELTGRSKCNVERCPEYSSPPGTTPEMCELEEWGTWSSCTTSCGPGIKTTSRKFRHRKYRKHCMQSGDIVLEQTIDCENEPCPDDDPDAEEVSEYETTEMMEGEIMGELKMPEEWMQKCPDERFTRWSEWSPCSSSCGPGVKLRSRLTNKSWSHLQDSEERDLEECKIQQASCDAEIPDCEFSEEIARSICSEPKIVGNCTGSILRVYFDSTSNECRWFSYTGCRGNRNNFPTEQDCNNVCSKYQRELGANVSTVMKKFKVSLSSVLTYHVPSQEQRSGKIKRAKYAEGTEDPGLGGIPSDNQVFDDPDGPAIDCEFTEWSPWSPCGPDCKGYTYSNRTILQQAKNGGKRCPTKLEQKRRCRKVRPCSVKRGMRRRSHSDFLYDSRENFNSVDCEVSPWSPWSPCTETCGNSVRHRTRNIVTTPVGPNAKLCPSLVKFVSCSVPECFTAGSESTWQ